MAFTKNVTKELTVYDDGSIGVLRRTVIFEDGEVVGEKLHRHVVAPGDDLVVEIPRVTAIATAIWTPKVIGDYAAKRAAALSSLEAPVQVLP